MPVNAPSKLGETTEKSPQQSVLVTDADFDRVLGEQTLVGVRALGAIASRGDADSIRIKAVAILIGLKQARDEAARARADREQARADAAAIRAAAAAVQGPIQTKLASEIAPGAAATAPAHAPPPAPVPAPAIAPAQVPPPVGEDLRRALAAATKPDPDEDDDDES